MNNTTRFLMIIFIVTGLAMAGCAQTPAPVEEQVEPDTVAEEVTVPAEEFAPSLQAAASFYPYYDLMRHIGGQHVDVHQIVPDGADPHSFEPSPRQLILLEESHVFLYNGLQMETWSDGVLDLLESSDVRIMEAGAFVVLIPYGGHEHEEEQNHDHDHDDHGHDDDDLDDHGHGDWDPHIWTDPVNMKIIAEEVAAVFSDLDPENASVYAENYREYASAVDELDESFRQLAEEADPPIMLVSHSAFGYLSHRYGFREIPVAGVTPHAEPNPGRMAELVKLAQEFELEYIFFETLANPKTAEVLAEEAGLTPLMLHNLEGLTPEQRDAGDDYFSLMQENVSTLRKAMVE